MRGRGMGWGAVAILALAAGGGCMVGRVTQGAPIPVDALAKLERGKTTRQQVLDLLGPPIEYKRPELADLLLSDEGVRLRPVAGRIASDVFTYQFTEGALNLGSVILFTYGRFDVRSNLLVVFFDERGIVEDFAYREQVPGASS